MALVTIATVRNGAVIVSLDVTGDNVTALSVVNNDTELAFVTVSRPNTQIITELSCPAGQTTTQNIQRNRQFSYATAADWTVGVSR